MMGRFAIGYERCCRAVLIAFTLNVAALVHTMLGLVVLGLFPSIGAMYGLWRTWLLKPEDRSWTVRQTWTMFHREWKSELRSANLLGWPMALLGLLVLYDYWVVNWHDAGIFGYACAGILLLLIVALGAFSMLVWTVHANFTENNRWCVRVALQMLIARPLCTLMMVVVAVLTIAIWLKWPGIAVVFGLALPSFLASICIYWFARLPGMDVRDSESYRAHHKVAVH